jgi:hypothetical protein
LASGTQIHDNNPGFPDNILWTIRIPASAVQVDINAGTARLQMTNVAVGDYTNFANALFGGGGPGLPGPFVPSTVSFDIRWFGVTAQRNVRNTDVGFAGNFMATDARADWSMARSGFTFHTSASGQNARSALIGHERNGSFFNS